MAENVHVKDQKTLLNTARNSPLNFAACLATKPEDTVLVMDKTKGQGPLREIAKKTGRTAKILIGQLQVSGKKVEFKCAEKPPSGAEKSFKQYFQKVLGMSLDIVLINANSQEHENSSDKDDSAANPASDGVKQQNAKDDTTAPSISPDLAKAQSTAKKVKSPVEAMVKSLLGRAIKQVGAMSLSQEEKKAFIGELVKGPVYEGSDKFLSKMTGNAKLRKAYGKLAKQVAQKL